VLGRVVSIDGVDRTIVGILPPASGFPSTAQVIVPLAQRPGLRDKERDAHNLRVFGRVRDDVSIADAAAEAERLASAATAKTSDRTTRRRVRVVPINERHLGRYDEPTWLAFIAAGGLVALISCANAANLMLAQALRRSREIALRTSLGATRARVIAQWLAESALLASLAGVLGLGVSLTGVRLLRMLVPAAAFPYWWAWELDLRVFGVLVVVSVATVLLMGLLPAWQASRVTAADVLKSGGRVVAGAPFRRLASALVVAEIALSVVLVSYLVLNQLTSEPDLASEPALHDSGVLTAALSPPADRYPNDASRARVTNDLLARLQGMRGVVAAAATSHLPAARLPERQIELAHGSANEPSRQQPVGAIAISPNYFAALGLPLLAGRDFVSADQTPGAPGVIVNERLAQQFFPDRNPIGEQLRLLAPQSGEASAPWGTIVAVAPAIRHARGNEPQPIAYLPLGLETPRTASVLIRSTRPSSEVARFLREQLQAVDPALPAYDVSTLREAVYQQDWLGLFSARLADTLSFMALVLTMFGLYAVTTHNVIQRTPEIGVRLALGARPVQVATLVLSRAGSQLAMGLVAGVAGAIAWDAAFFQGREGFGFATPSMLLQVGGILLIVAIVACAVPAVRATRVDPIKALADS
jgi:putative ABC transport system permease protein